MTNFIPLFPLGIVVFPGELLNLHIFEPRYRQLIQECHEEGRSFGIPAVIGNRVQETGTLVQLEEVVKTYEAGQYDASSAALFLFKLNGKSVRCDKGDLIPCKECNEQQGDE